MLYKLKKPARPAFWAAFDTKLTPNFWGCELDCGGLAHHKFYHAFQWSLSFHKEYLPFVLRQNIRSVRASDIPYRATKSDDRAIIKRFAQP
jgi:hypothetical protein